jgi:hypothetical protein
MTLKATSRRSGAVAPLVALLMVVLCVCISIVLEEGMMLSESRHAQAVADASAMAGACVLFQNYRTDATPGIDSGSTAAALQIAHDNGYLNDASGNNPNPNTTSVVVNNPPLSGPYTGVANYVEVIVTYNQGRYFSWVLSMWPINATLSNTMPITARAVGVGAWTVPNEGMLLLGATGPDLTTKGGGGNGGGIVTNGNVIVDALNGQDITQTGNSSIVAGGVLAVSGNQTGLISSTQSYSSYSPGSSGIYAGNGSTSVFINQHPTPDPLSYLPQPGSSVPGTPAIPNAAPAVVGPITLLDGTSNVYIAYPGRYGPGYTSLPPDKNGNTIIFMQANYPKNTGRDIFNDTTTSGIYYIDGGFSYRNAVVVMDNNMVLMNSSNTNVAWNGLLNNQGSSGGMMIYMNSGAFSLEGNPNGLVYLGNLTNGVYSGLSVWQPSSNTSTDKVAGNGSFTITGTFYAPTALLTVDGNGGSSVSNTGNWQAGSQVGGNFIGQDVNVVGNGTQYVRTNPNGAKTRILTLVE